MDYIKIFVDGQIVGHVRGGTFFKIIRGSRHILRTPRAIALDAKSLDDAERAGAVTVEVRDSETGDIYRATIEHIRQAGFELNRGYGRQIALVLDGWVKTRKGDFGVQLALWRV